MPDPDRARADLVQLAHDLDTVDPERARVLRDALASLAEERNDLRAALAAAAPYQDRLVSCRVAVHALRTDLDTARHLLSLWTDTRPPLEEVEGETLAALTVRFLAESSHHPAESVNVDRAQVAALGGAR